MTNKIITRQVRDMNQGIQPNIYKDGLARIEHFDLVSGQARPYHPLTLSTTNGLSGTSLATLALLKLTAVSGTIYGVGVDNSTPTYGAIYSWDATNEWQTKLTFGATSAPNALFFSHKGVLYGLRNSQYVYSIHTDGTLYVASHTDLTSVSSFADAFTHSKDGCTYFATDNKIHKLSTAADGTAGTGYSLVLTLPNTNFVITSIAEQGNFINICGYDSTTRISSSLKWDRDTSVTDITESYILGPERVYHNATLGGRTFFVQMRLDQTNTTFAEQPILVIKYLSGDVPEIILELPMKTGVLEAGGLLMGKFVDNDRLYFAGYVRLLGESASTWRCFVLDKDGKLSIAQNIGVDTGTVAITGVHVEGQGFWFTAGADGAWSNGASNNTAYGTTSIIETTKVRSDDLAKNVSFKGMILSCEPLPTAGQIVIAARKNSSELKVTPDATWTTLKTFNSDDDVKLGLPSAVAKNALSLANVKEFQLRVESTGGAVVTGLQYAYEENDAESYG